MSRSLKKGPYVDQNLLKKVLAYRQKGLTTPIKTWSRGSQIPPEFVGQRISVYNGRTFIEVFVNETMVGHRLGEFSPTRTFKGHGQVTKRLLEKT